MSINEYQKSACLDYADMTKCLIALRKEVSTEDYSGWNEILDTLCSYLTEIGASDVADIFTPLFEVLKFKEGS